MTFGKGMSNILKQVFNYSGCMFSIEASVRITIFLLRKRKTGSLKNNTFRRCPIFHPKSSEEQKIGHHVSEIAISTQNRVKSKKTKIITSAGRSLS